MRARRLSFALVGLIVLSGAWASGGWARAEQAAQPLTADQRIFGLAKIWSEVKYNFANFDLVPDLDWDKAFQEYLPQARQEQSTAQYYKLLERFIALLHDGHTDISPPAHVRDLSDAPPIVMESIEGKAVILDLAEVDELKDAGLSRGAEITKIDGRPMAEVLQQDLYPFMAQSTPQGRDATAYGQLLRGPKGSRVVVEVRDLEGNTHTATLTRDSGTPGARRFYQGLNRPTVEMRRFPGGIVYFAWNSFGVDQAVADFDRMFDGLANIRGMIIDVRHNGGGNSTNGDAVTKRLIDKPAADFVAQLRQHISALGEFWFRAEGGTIDPRGKNPFLGPVVVLTSRHTASAAEDFVVVLHGNQRAVVVGGKTMGTTGQPVSFALPGGGSARICAKKCFYPDGRPFVGVGIIPDVEVYPSQKDVAAGRDAVLEKGLEVLKGKMTSTSLAEAAFTTMDPALAEGDYYRRHGPLSEAIRSYKEAARLNPGAVAAHLRLADLYRWQGDEQKAAEQCQAAGFAGGHAWMIIGPFDNANGSGLDTEYPPEQEVDFTKECTGKTGSIRWFRHAGRRTDGFVDLASVLKPNEWSIAYAATQVDSPAARDVQLRIGTDDEAKVWLNGNLVLNSRVPRFAAIDQDIVSAHLRAGRNEILMKVCNRTESWGFYLRVTDVLGRPRADLRFSP
jgi:carboxyl-terminal processing protease